MSRRLVHLACPAAALAAAILIVASNTAAPAAMQTRPRQLSAGAAMSNITPPLGEPIVGNWTPVPATHIHDELFARCLVLDDGATRVAIVVADNVGIPQPVLDEAKRLAQEHTGIPISRILIASTHTHSATSARGGDRPDIDAPSDRYEAFLASRIADGIRRAVNNLEPARIGWGSGRLAGQVFNRRWFMTDGPELNNPFGGRDRVRMNPPMASADLLKPAGPTDPEIAFLSVYSASGRPIALLANYSLHYVGGVANGHVSADYFGVFARRMVHLLASGEGERGAPPFVAMLSNGTSGDINNIDFRGGQKRLPPYERMTLVANQVAAEVFRALQDLEYHEWVPLEMLERNLTLATRRPDQKGTAWARAVLARPVNAPAGHPRERTYAERTLRMAGMPAEIAVPLQALRIGELGIVTIPFEVFVEIGLELKEKSPLPQTFVMSLANGAYGYLPTPAHHELGGYETWLGTSQVDVHASTRIVETLLGMLAELKRGSADARGPLAPEEALASFALEPGYRIEIAAAEPVVVDPVAMAFDARGRMYVVENRAYPGPVDGSAPAAAEGVIALLEDRDGDGRFETRHDFARGLTYPNGVMPWDGGVFVTCAPDLLFLKDTDGDGTADLRQVILTGFETSRTPQIRFSHPTLGIDNRVYLTGGLNGGVVTAPAHPERPAVTFTAGDSRFDPFTHAFEVTGGNGQFGLTFDDHGRRFICSNRHPVLHVVLERGHLQRNPHLAFSQTVHEVSAVGTQAAVWPLSADTTTASFHPDLLSTPHAGTFTAASGVHIHRGGALPKGHEDSIFICESAQNLVQRQVRSPDGVTFSSRPARTGREFLASTDNWFRPVFAANGPDGALYIVDMYRKTIDHPQYVPEPGRSELDFESGRKHGRIYRIAGEGWRADRQSIDLSGMTGAELARTLEHPNAWWRETAQRLLITRRPSDALPVLQQILGHGRTDAARIHALWTLDGFGALATEDILRALRDGGAPVRENAVRLSASRLNGSTDLSAAVTRLAADPDVRVRLQVALAAGGTDDHRATRALASIAHRDGADSWMRAAVLSSLAGRTSEFLRTFSALPAASPDARASVLEDLARLFGAGETVQRCFDLMELVLAPDSASDDGWQFSALAALAEGLKARQAEGEPQVSLFTLATADSPPAREAASQLERVLHRAEAVALDGSSGTHTRIAATRLLAHAPAGAHREGLLALVAPHHPPELQAAAVRALLRYTERDAAARLLDAPRWAGLTPQVRETVLSSLLASEASTSVLLDALEAKQLPATTLGAGRRNRLMNHKDGAIRARARTLLAIDEPGTRMAVYERLRGEVSSLAGDPHRGSAIFARSCAACHTFDGAGGQLGPDLSGIRNQPADAILLHVLVPDHEITPGYQTFTVQTRDGRTLAGRLESEAPNSLTLRDAGSAQQVILRTEVASMSSSPTSLMPAEFERALSVQDLSDLLAYLKRPAVQGVRRR